MKQQTIPRLANRASEDPVGFWLGRLDADTQRANRSHFNRWMQWLNEQKGWQNVTPRELLIRHSESEDRYLVLETANYATKLG